MRLFLKILYIVLGLFFLAFVIIQLFAIKSQKNIETYNYIVEDIYDSFEVRTYESALFTSVKLPEAPFDTSSSQGFSILAGYIFGNNNENKKIAMTSPVSMTLEDSMTMMFMVPKKYNMESLPKPTQSNIEIKKIESKKMAAINFGGWANDKKINLYKSKLISLLKSEGISFSDNFFFFGYNAPYEFFNRRNEVLVEL